MTRFVVIAIFLSASQSAAQDAVDTTALVAPDTLTTLDSLTATETTIDRAQALQEFEERYRQRQLTQNKKRAPRFNYFDSLAAYFLPQRWNGRAMRERSFFHDAGDYFRSSPEHFDNDYQETPMRQTVQPFGLTGDRLNLVHDGVALTPFDHVPEPDGMIDLNDIPTALDEDIYVLPGAIGSLFGGDNMVASLVTRPRRPASYTPISAFIVDKGSFAYSYARGKYQKRFKGGREINWSIGYRKADGFTFNRRDDASHMFTTVFFPLREKSGFAGSARLYDRDGPLAVRPDATGRAINRDRLERSLHLTYYRENESSDARFDVGYRYDKQETRLGTPYNGLFRNTTHGGFVSREWLRGSTLLRAELSGTFNRYEEGNLRFRRWSQRSSFTLAHLREHGRLALYVGQQWVDRFGLLPAASIIYLYDVNKLHFLLSAGYTTKAPRLFELNHEQFGFSLYGVVDDYLERGNPNLSKEKQLVGTVEAELGSLDNSVGLSITGGRIIDGINWQSATTGTTTSFTSSNADIDFVSFSVRSRIKLLGLFHLTGGGAYNYLADDRSGDLAYTPEYHAFSGGELHVFWKQKLVHLHAYGEFVYTGPYVGYSGRALGDNLVANAKLSIRMGKFRFHYVFQNVSNAIYEPRERFRSIGRYTYYGFVWDFLD